MIFDVQWSQFYKILYIERFNKKTPLKSHPKILFNPKEAKMMYIADNTVTNMQFSIVSEAPKQVREFE